jgi:protein SCO1/2
MNRNTLLTVAVLLLAGILVWMLFFWEPGKQAVPQPGQPLALASTPSGGDFTLTGSKGDVSLADFRGKVVVLYFGYTYCPDVCPMSLALIAQGLSGLDDAALQKVQGIFVSVDPERDTPQRLAEYAPFFHPRLIGVTGTPEQIAAVARMYGSSYRKQPKGPEGHYAVDHSSVTYIIAPDGKLADLLQHGSPPESITVAINKALASSK